MYPKLRSLQPMPIVHEGRAGFMLHDPLALCEKKLFLPREMSPLLALCDGTRDLAGLQAALMIRFGMRVSQETLARLIAQFDSAYLLDNEHSTQAHDAALATYRDASFRPPRLAGHSYPADPSELTAYLATFQTESRHDECAPETDTQVRGVVCPHIDFQRGGQVYAGLWHRAAAAARRAELIVVLGTDHNSGSLITLTRQHYATPLGLLPTSREVVDALASAAGEEAFQNELYHQVEHSIELAIIWVQAALGKQTPELVPVLTGPLHRFISGQESPDNDEKLAAVVTVLRKAMNQRRTLVVAAADLAHMGPAFGGSPLNVLDRAALKRADEQLLETICQGDATAFFNQIKSEGDRRNICGLPPIYLALRALGQVRGQVTGYEICPADQKNTSSVSVTGVLLR